MSNLLYIVAIACAVWVIYDVWANRKSMSSGTKVIWTVCALFFSIITAIVYAVMGKK